GSGDEVYVVATAAGHPLEIAKNISVQVLRAIDSGAARICGELAGISVLPRSFIGHLAAARGSANFDQRDYESFIVEFAARSSIEVCWLQGVPWTEIDNPADLQRARMVVWPRLAREREVEMGFDAAGAQ